MFRQRLKSNQGCLRCKSRHQKCDEKRPKCDFCKRWNISCVWPGGTSRQPKNTCERWLHTSDGVPLFGRPAEAISASPDCHVHLPVRDQHNRPETVRDFRVLFANMISQSLPFDITTIQPQIARTWFHALFSEEAACYSFLSCCFLMEFGHSGQVLTQRQSLVFQTHTLSLLRRCVNAGDPITEGILMAAALHFQVTTADLVHAPEMPKTLKGLKAMVDSRGGFGSLDSPVGFVTKTVLSACDTTSAIYNGVDVLLEQIGHPPKPHSFNLIYRASKYSLDLVSRCGPDVLYVLQCLTTVLFFRAPSQQARSLQFAESWYLVVLVRHINCQLAVLQARHLGSHSFSEIVALAMILLKFEVLPESLDPQAIVATVLVRLRAAITRADHAEKSYSQSVLIWVYTIASIGRGAEDNRRWFFDLLFSALCERHDEDSAWLLEWERSLLNELRQYLWHVTMDRSFVAICHKLRARRAQRPHPDLQDDQCPSILPLISIPEERASTKLGRR